MYLQPYTTKHKKFTENMHTTGKVAAEETIKAFRKSRYVPISRSLVVLKQLYLTKVPLGGIIDGTEKI